MKILSLVFLLLAAFSFIIAAIKPLPKGIETGEVPPEILAKERKTTLLFMVWGLGLLAFAVILFFGKTP